MNFRFFADTGLPIADLCLLTPDYRSDLGLGEPADDHVEDRREKNAEDGHAQHAAEDGDAEGFAHFRAGALGQDQRNHSQDESEGGHQDGPEAQPAGLDGGFDPAFAFVLKLLGKLHDQNGVLGRQADQHHQADLRKDVIVHPRQPDAGDGGQKTHRYDENDRQRQRPATASGKASLVRISVDARIC